MALAAWALGGLLLVARRPVGWVSRGLAAAGERLGPRRIYEAWLHGLSWVSAAVHDREVRDLRTSIAAVLVPAGVLIALAFAATPTAGAYTAGLVAGLDWLVLPLLGLVVVVAVVIAWARARLTVVLALSVVGFALAAVYALLGAPDVALVAVVVETMLTLVFLAALARLPDERPDHDRARRARPEPAPRRRGRRGRGARGVRHRLGIPVPTGRHHGLLRPHPAHPGRARR